MKASQYDPRGKPRHLAVVRWFQVEGVAPHLRVSERRAVFYRWRVRWADHPWSHESPGRGADFFDQWTVESLDHSGCSAGRTSHGWGALTFRPDSWAASGFDVHDTRREAELVAFAKLERYANMHHHQAADADDAVRDWKGARP